MASINFRVKSFKCNRSILFSAEGAISCQIDSPTRDECIKRAMQEMLPRLQVNFTKKKTLQTEVTVTTHSLNSNQQKGMAYLNIPPIDPYTVNGTTFDYKRGDIVASMNIKTVTFRGLSKSDIKDVRTKIDDNGMSTEVDVFIPRLYAEGLYKATGKVNTFKINAKGAFNITFKDVSTTQKMKGVFETIDGERYLRVESYDLIPTIGDLKVQMTGIFPDPELSEREMDGSWGCSVNDILSLQTNSQWNLSISTGHSSTET